MMYLDLDEAARGAGRPVALVGAPRGAGMVPPGGLSRRSRRCRWPSRCGRPWRGTRARGRAGPIRLLTHLRYYGYCFNPVSFYYCFDEQETRVDTILAEITNTPWKERHAYVLPRTPSMNGVMRFRFEKAFHVSPFMPMDQRYDWRFSPPGQRLAVHMENTDARGRIFDATMSLTRREITGAALARALLAYPWMTASVATAIHWNALRIWLKGNPYVPHPAKGSA